jgi:hypothetical protein
MKLNLTREPSLLGKRASIIARYRRYEGNPPITPVQTRATAFVEPRAWETSRSPRGPMNTCKRRRRDSFQLGLPNSQNAAPIRTLGHWERFLNATPPSRRELVRHMHELNTLVGGAGPGRVQSSAPTQHLSGGIACWRGAVSGTAGDKLSLLGVACQDSRYWCGETRRQYFYRADTGRD